MTAYVRNGADLIAVITNDGGGAIRPRYGQHETLCQAPGHRDKTLAPCAAPIPANQLVIDDCSDERS